MYHQMKMILKTILLLLSKMAELIYHLGREMPTVGGSVDPAEFNHDTGILDSRSPYLIPALDYLSLSAMETDGGNVTVKIGKDGHDVKAIQVKLRQEPFIPWDFGVVLEAGNVWKTGVTNLPWQAFEDLNLPPDTVKAQLTPTGTATGYSYLDMKNSVSGKEFYNTLVNSAGDLCFSIEAWDSVGNYWQQNTNTVELTGVDGWPNPQINFDKQTIVGNGVDYVQLGAAGGNTYFWVSTGGYFLFDGYNYTSETSPKLTCTRSGRTGSIYLDATISPVTITLGLINLVKTT